MELLNHFNGISLAVIMILSYCAELKNTNRNERINRQGLSRKYRTSSASKKAAGLGGDKEITDS